MNANELIDLLHTEDVQFSQQSVNDWAEEAITMLRQQQAEIEALETELFVKDAFLKTSICLTKAELESGLTRVQWAEALIKQLPEEHEGRNSWLLNYGEEK